MGKLQTTDYYADCGACSKTKAKLELVVGKDMCVLYEHVGVVVSGTPLMRQ